MNIGDRVHFVQYGCGCARAEDCIDPVSYRNSGQDGVITYIEDSGFNTDIIHITGDNGESWVAFEDEVTRV